MQEDKTESQGQQIINQQGGASNELKDYLSFKLQVGEDNKTSGSYLYAHRTIANRFAAK